MFSADVLNKLVKVFVARLKVRIAFEFAANIKSHVIIWCCSDLRLSVRCISDIRSNFRRHLRQCFIGRNVILFALNSFRYANVDFRYYVVCFFLCWITNPLLQCSCPCSLNARSMKRSASGKLAKAVSAFQQMAKAPTSSSWA